MANVFFNLDYEKLGDSKTVELIQRFGIQDSNNIREMAEIGRPRWKKPSQKLMVELDYWYYRDMADYALKAIIDSGAKGVVYVGLPANNIALTAIFSGVLAKFSGELNDNGLKIHLLAPVHQDGEFIGWLEVN